MKGCGLSFHWVIQARMSLVEDDGVLVGLVTLHDLLDRLLPV
jgi:CBS domain-containing protein